MSDGVKLKWGSLSVTNLRDNNEDNLFVDDDGRFFLVADGMGGQNAGEKASELAIEQVSRKLSQSVKWTDGEADDEIVRKIDAAVDQANAEIIALGNIQPECKSMGTTITFIIAVKEDLFVGGVGDSRTYQLRGGTLQQLTEDHTLTQALLKAGTITEEDAVNHRYKNHLYKYLGTKDGGNGTEAQKITAQPGDRYLLCSDGVTDGANDEEVQRILTEENDPQAAAEALVKAAQKGGSRDNITCIVVHVG